MRITETLRVDTTRVADASVHGRGRPALFLDRDGTLIADRGDLGDPASIEFLPGVVDVLRELRSRFACSIITNQSAVSAVGIESTIVDFCARPPRILRPGAIPAEDLCAVLCEDVVQGALGQPVVAPGMLPRHYAPRVRLHLFEGRVPVPPTASSALHNAPHDRGIRRDSATRSC